MGPARVLARRFDLISLIALGLWFLAAWWRKFGVSVE